MKLFKKRKKIESLQNLFFFDHNLNYFQLKMWIICGKEFFQKCLRIFINKQSIAKNDLNRINDFLIFLWKEKKNLLLDNKNIKFDTILIEKLEHKFKEHQIDFEIKKYLNN
jgi:hypothetical protein